METLESLYQPIFRALVLILPMRNGNYSLQKYRCKNLYSCSYPTYEEWKHEVIIGDSDEMYVLILPMRNGNDIYFMSYDIEENCSYPTYEEWKLSLLLTIL